jgi:ferric-dicitrate binding protein FerR (iron transport regulator)
MNTHTESYDENGRPAGDDALAQLIRRAGRRPEPPLEAYRQVLQATTEVLDRKVRNRRRTRIAYALAASILLGVGAFGLVQQITAPAYTPAQVATVDHGFGLIMVKGPADEKWRTLDGGLASLDEGVRVRTGSDSGLGLRLSGGESLRLAQQTEISIVSADRIHLDRGTAYLDTGPVGVSGLEIYTPLGVIRHIGTQFEATYTVNQMRLRVREGVVQLQRGAETSRAEAGTQVVINFEGDTVESTIAPYGEDWDWVQALAPMPDTDEQTLAAFLEWIARETGRSIHFANRDLRVRANTIVLHGQTRRLMPMEALAVMLQTTDFQYTVTGESEILIEDHRL